MVFYNGKFVSIKEASILVTSPGFLHGFGLFETMRSYYNRIVYLDEHLSRIKQSCRIVKLTFNYSIKELKKILKQTIRINSFKDAYVRLTVCKGEQRTNVLVMVKKYHPYSAIKYRQGFKAKVSSLRQNKDSRFSRLKTTSRLFYELSFQEARREGFDEAVILNNHGHIVEASRSNIFFVKHKQIFTPSLECGCLEGITRKVILGLSRKFKFKSYEGKFVLMDLLNADEAFLTNSLIGVMPLRVVEKYKIGKGKCGKITEFFIEKYNLLLKKNEVQKNKISFQDKKANIGCRRSN